MIFDYHSHNKWTENMIIEHDSRKCKKQPVIIEVECKFERFWEIRPTENLFSVVIKQENPYELQELKRVQHNTRKGKNCSILNWQ